MAETHENRALEDWLELWLETRLTVRDCGRTVDLDEPIELSIGLPITIVTVWNPMGVERGRALNRAANRDLRRRLDERRLAWRPAVGRSADGSWFEPGFAIAGLSKTEAAEVGHQVQQLAVFYVTDADVEIIDQRSVVSRRPRALAPRRDPE